MTSPADAPKAPHAGDPAPLPPVNSRAASAAEPSEEIIYKGPVSLWMGWKALAGAALSALVGFVLLVYGLFQSAGSFKSACIVIGGALFVAGLVMVPYLIWSIRSLRYTITTRLIEREKGLFIKRVDSLDLGRVKDVELTQSLFQRIFKVGTLEVFSSDRTDPDMLIECIPNPRPIYERLRNAVIGLAQRRGIIPLDR